MSSNDQTVATTVALRRSGHRPALPLALLASFGFATAVTPDRSQALAGLLLGLSAAGLALWRPSVRLGSVLYRLLISLGPLLFGLTWLRGPRVDPFPEPDWVRLVGGTVWLACAVPLMWRGERLGTWLRPLIVAAGLATTTLIGVVLLDAARDVGLDVAHLHVAAAEALADGASPYSAAVTVLDGSPLAEPDDYFVGYPYPPTTLVPFVASELILDDPRWVSLGAWLLFLVVLARSALREEGEANAMATFVLAASLPGWPLILLTGWTEPISLIFLTGAFVLWKRSRTGSATSLGVGLVSKQYLAVVWPMVLRWRLPDGRRRALIVSVAAAAALAPLVMWGPGDVYRSLVEVHLTRPPRPDGTSLVGFMDLAGLAWAPPAWLTVVLPVGLALILGGFVHDRRSYGIVSGLVLATIFLFSSQAFMNYWLLPAGLIGLAAADSREDAPDG